MFGRRPFVRWRRSVSPFPTAMVGKFKGLLVAQARVLPGHRVLDLGCRTGTLTILLRSRRSSLVFHHLTTENKRRMLRRIGEWLRPGGELHAADWGRAQDPLMRLAFLPVQILDGFATTSESVRGLLVPLMREAGFEEVAETYQERTALGTLSLYRTY